MNTLLDALREIESTIRGGRAGTSPTWGGAGVQICIERPQVDGGFGQNIRFVETQFVGELSWLFERLKKAFIDSPGYGRWKEEFFGRLGNVATKYQSAAKNLTKENLLLAVLHEGYAMAEELTDEGTIVSLPLTLDGMVLDDVLNTSDLGAYLTTEETYQFLQDLGLA